MSPIVLLHGWGTGVAVFEPLREHLNACTDVRVLSLAGYDASSACEPYTLQSIAERVSAVAPARCCVIGWSLGAQVALVWASAKPRQVEALALIGATPCFVEREDWACAMERSAFDTFSAALEHDVAATLARFCALQTQGEDDAHSTARRLRAAVKAGVTPTKDVLANGLRILLETDLRPQLRAIEQPALVVHGECDPLVPFAAAEYFARGLPRSRLESLPRVGHAPFVSAPRRVGTLVQEFFNER